MNSLLAPKNFLFPVGSCLPVGFIHHKVPTSLTLDKAYISLQLVTESDNVSVILSKEQTLPLKIFLYGKKTITVTHPSFPGCALLTGTVDGDYTEFRFNITEQGVFYGIDENVKRSARYVKSVSVFIVNGSSDLRSIEQQFSLTENSLGDLDVYPQLCFVADSVISSNRFLLSWYDGDLQVCKQLSLLNAPSSEGAGVKGVYNIPLSTLPQVRNLSTVYVDLNSLFEVTGIVTVAEVSGGFEVESEFVNLFV